MKQLRLSLAMALFWGLCGGAVLAQDSGSSGSGGSGGSSGGGGSGSSSGGSSGSGSTSGSGGNGSSGSSSESEDTSSGASTSFGSPGLTPGGSTIQPTTPSGGQGPAGAGNGSPSGTGGTGGGILNGTTTNPTMPPGVVLPSGPIRGGGSATSGSAPTFTVPSLYGQGAQTFVGGQGRLSRPRYQYSGSIQIGADDNVLSTPTSPFTSPAVFQEVEISPAIPEQDGLAPNTPTGPGVLPGHGQGNFPAPQNGFHKVVLAPAQPAKFQKVLVSPAVPSQPRIASFVFQANVGASMQFASHKSLFTLDANINSTTYTNRPGRASDPGGSLGLIYAYRFTPRVQFSLTVNASYLSQPDTSLVNSNANNQGSFFPFTIKADASYQWARRFSTVTSLTEDGIQYQEAAAQNSSFHETVFGQEARYLWSPRLTAIGEVRYSVKSNDDPQLDSNTVELLAGAEFIMSRRFSGSLRIGVSSQDLTLTGYTTTSPYFETSLNWRYSTAGLLSLTARYGFENPIDIHSSVTTLRLSVGATQAFSRRLRGGLTISFADSNNQETASDVSSAFTSDQRSITAGLNVEYLYSRHITFTGSYTYTSTMNTGGFNNAGSFQDYYRNQLFLGVSYTF